MEGERRVKMDVYDIYGFVLGVDGSARSRFREEYRRFVATDSKADLDLLIMEHREGTPLLVRPKGERWGLKLPTCKTDKTIAYNTQVNLDFVLAMFEGYLTWPDKVFLHAGAVTRGNEAFVFTGSGNVGKTSLVLQALKHGYRYSSDDWLVIGNGMAYPFPKRLRMFDYNIVYDKQVRKKLLGRRACALSPLLVAHYYTRRFLVEIAPHPYLKRALNVLRPIYHVDIEKLVPNAKISDITKIKHIMFLERRDVPSVIIGEISPRLLATKMVAMNFFERHAFFQQYFLASFLNGVDDKIQIGERLEREREIMQDTFSRAVVYHTQIPKQMSPEKLWKALVKEGFLKE